MKPYRDHFLFDPENSNLKSSNKSYVIFRVSVFIHIYFHCIGFCLSYRATMCRTSFVKQVSATGREIQQNRAEKGRDKVQKTRVPEKGCPIKGEKGPEKG